MADFGKLNFSTSFNPTSAFPLDARCYFDGDTAYEDAKAAAKKAEDVGSTNTIYHYGMKLLVNQSGSYAWYTITTSNTLQLEGTGGSGTSFNIGSGLILNTETNTLSVDVADAAEEDNTRPISSVAVYSQIGNIAAILDTI